MRWKVDWVALAFLCVVVVATLAALWFAYEHHLKHPIMYRFARPIGWASDFGDYATLISVVAFPLIAWLAHRAFRSKLTR
jgi:hypothetical protein